MFYKAEEGRGSGRVSAIGVAPISEVDVSTGLAKVALTAAGAKSESNWMWRLTQANGLTLPAYSPGDTLVYACLDNDLNTAFQLGVVQNNVNPPSEQDRLTYVLGDSKIVVKEDVIELTLKSAAFSITESSITLQVGGTSLVIADGSIYVNSPGKQITTLGAKDSHNDTVNQKGWP